MKSILEIKGVKNIERKELSLLKGGGDQWQYLHDGYCHHEGTGMGNTHEQTVCYSTFYNTTCYCQALLPEEDY